MVIIFLNPKNADGCVRRGLIQPKESYIWRTTGHGFRPPTFLSLHKRFRLQTSVYCPSFCGWLSSLCHLCASHFRSSSSSEWLVQAWGLANNPKKCSAMCITPKKNMPPMNFTFFGQVLENLTSHPYLGVLFDRKWCWKEHIEFVDKGDNKILGIIRRKCIKCPCIERLDSTM